MRQPGGLGLPRGHPNPPTNRFCSECGATLAAVNPSDQADEAMEAPGTAPGFPQPASAAPGGVTARPSWQPRAVGVAGVLLVIALIAVLVTSSKNDTASERPQADAASSVNELAEQYLRDNCDIPGDGSLEHLSTSPTDDDLTEIAFTTSEDFVGSVYMDQDSEFLDQVDCPGSAENSTEVPPEWEGVGDPVEYLVASECGFGPETRFDLTLISISDPPPGEDPTWEIGLPDGTTGRLLPNGEVECPEVPDTTTVPSAELTLRPDGLGIVNLGDPEQEAYDTLTAAFGSPTSDATEPGCAEGNVRFLQWGNLFVSMLQGTVAAYTYTDQGQALPDLASEPLTPEGIGIGSTVSDLQAAYGDQLTMQYVEYGDLGDQFQVGDGTGLNGSISGQGPSDVVLSIGANRICI